MQLKQPKLTLMDYRTQAKILTKKVKEQRQI